MSSSLLSEIDVNKFVSLMNLSTIDTVEDITVNAANGIKLLDSIILASKLDPNELRLALFTNVDKQLLSTYIKSSESYKQNSSFHNIIYLFWVLVNYVFKENERWTFPNFISSISTEVPGNPYNMLPNKDTIIRIIKEFMTYLMNKISMKLGRAITKEERIELLKLMLINMPNTVIVSLFNYLKSNGEDCVDHYILDVYELLNTEFKKIEEPLSPDIVNGVFNKIVQILKSSGIKSENYVGYITENGGVRTMIQKNNAGNMPHQQPGFDPASYPDLYGGAQTAKSVTNMDGYIQKLNKVQLNLQKALTRNELLEWVESKVVDEVDKQTLNLLQIFGNLISQMYVIWEYYKQNKYIEILMQEFQKSIYAQLKWDLTSTYSYEDVGTQRDDAINNLFNLCWILAQRMSIRTDMKSFDESLFEILPSAVLVLETEFAQSQISLLQERTRTTIESLTLSLSKIAEIANREKRSEGLLYGEQMLKDALNQQKERYSEVLYKKLETLYNQLDKFQKDRQDQETNPVPNCTFSPTTKALSMIIHIIAGKVDNAEHILYQNKLEMLVLYAKNLLDFLDNVIEYIGYLIASLHAIETTRDLQASKDGLEAAAARSNSARLPTTVDQLSTPVLQPPLDLTPIDVDTTSMIEGIMKNIKSYIECLLFLAFSSLKTQIFTACLNTYSQILRKEGIVYNYVALNREILGIPLEYVKLWISNLLFMILDCANDLKSAISNNSQYIGSLLSANMLTTSANMLTNSAITGILPIERFFERSDVSITLDIGDIESNPDFTDSPSLFALAKQIHVLSMQVVLENNSLLFDLFRNLSFKIYPHNISQADFVDTFRGLSSSESSDVVDLQTEELSLAEAVRAALKHEYDKSYEEFAGNTDPTSQNRVLRELTLQTGLTAVSRDQFDIHMLMSAVAYYGNIFTIKYIEETLLTLFTDLLGQVNICIRVGTANPSLVRSNPEEATSARLLRNQIKAMNLKFYFANSYTKHKLDLVQPITNMGVYPVELDMDYIASQYPWRFATRSLTTYSYELADGTRQTSIILHNRNILYPTQKIKALNKKLNKPEKSGFREQYQPYLKSGFIEALAKYERERHKIKKMSKVQKVDFLSMGNFDVYTDTVYCFSNKSSSLRTQTDTLADTLAEIKNSPAVSIKENNKLEALCKSAIPYYLPVTSVSLMYGQTVLTPIDKVTNSNITSGFYRDFGEGTKPSTDSEDDTKSSKYSDKGTTPSKIIHMTEGLVTVMHQTLSGHTSSVFGYGGSGSGKTYNLLGSTRSTSVDFGILQEMVIYGLCKNYYFDVSTIYDVYGKVSIFATDQKFKMGEADIAGIPIFGNINKRQEKQNEFDGYCFANSRTVKREYHQHVFNYQVDINDDNLERYFDEELQTLTSSYAELEKSSQEAMRIHEQIINLQLLVNAAKVTGPAEAIFMKAMFNEEFGKKLKFNTDNQTRPTGTPAADSTTNSHLTGAFPSEEAMDQFIKNGTDSFCAEIMNVHESADIDYKLLAFLAYGILSMDQLQSLKQNILNSLIAMFSMSDEKKNLYDFHPDLLLGQLMDDTGHYTFKNSMLVLDAAGRTVKLRPTSNWEEGWTAPPSTPISKDEIFDKLDLFMNKIVLCLTYLQFITNSIEIERRTGKFKKQQDTDIKHFQFQLEKPLRIAPTPNNPESSRSLLCINLKFFAASTTAMNKVPTDPKGYGILNLCDTAGAETLEKLIDSMAQKIPVTDSERGLIVGDYFNFMLGLPIWIYFRDLADYGLHYDDNLERLREKSFTVWAERETYVQPPDWSTMDHPKPETVLKTPLLTTPSSVNSTFTDEKVIVLDRNGRDKDTEDYIDWLQRTDREVDIRFKQVYAQFDMNTWDKKTIHKNENLVLPLELASQHPYFVMRIGRFGNELWDITYGYEKLEVPDKTAKWERETFELAYDWTSKDAEIQEKGINAMSDIIKLQRTHLLEQLKQQSIEHNQRIFDNRDSLKPRDGDGYHPLSCFRLGYGLKDRTGYRVQPDFAALSLKWKEKFQELEDKASVYGDTYTRIGPEGPGSELVGTTLESQVNPDGEDLNEVVEIEGVYKTKLEVAKEKWIETKKQSMPNRKISRVNTVFNAFGAQFLQQFQDELRELLNAFIDNKIKLTSDSPLFKDSTNPLPVQKVLWYSAMFGKAPLGYSDLIGQEWNKFITEATDVPSLFPAIDKNKQQKIGLTRQLLLGSLLEWISPNNDDILDAIEPTINYEDFSTYFQSSFSQVPYLLAIQLNKLIFLMWTYLRCYLYAFAQVKELTGADFKTNKTNNSKHDRMILKKAKDNLDSIVDSFLKSILNESIYITYSIRDMKEIFHQAQKTGLSDETATEVSRKYTAMPKQCLVYYTAEHNKAVQPFIEFFRKLKQDWVESTEAADPDYEYDFGDDLFGCVSTNDISKLQPESGKPIYCFIDKNDSRPTATANQMTLVGNVFTHIYTTTNLKEKCTRFTQLFTVRPEGPLHADERHYFSTSDTLQIAKMLKLSFDG